MRLLKHARRLLLSFSLLLAALVACTLILDAVYTYYYSVPPPASDTFDARASKLDDPLNYRRFWLVQQGFTSNISFHSGDGDPYTADATQQPVLGVLCDNSCFKARDGVCDEGRKGNLSTPSRVSWVRCDLGTDCHDCGPWHGVRHGPAWTEGVGPIAYLQLHGIEEVRVRKVPYAPGFLFAYTDPDLDTDQSVQMTAEAVVEPTISQIFHAALSSRCNASAPGTSGLVLDVGANFGWFSLLSASLGCSVVAIEPVPLFRAFMEYSAARNHLTSYIEVLSAVVAPKSDTPYTVNVPLKGHWGAAGVHVRHHRSNLMQVPARAVQLDDLAFLGRASSLLSSASNSSSSSIQDAQGDASHEGLASRAAAAVKAKATKVSNVLTNAWHAVFKSKGNNHLANAMDSADADQQHHLPVTRKLLMQEQRQQQKSTSINPSSSTSSNRISSSLLASNRSIDIMKVDVEGHEADVFDTAQELLSSDRVQHIVFEYSPGHFYHTNVTQLERLPQLLLGQIRNNYSLVHVPWHVAHDATAVKEAGGWAAPLPPLDAITKPQLAYDVWTVQQIKNGSLPGMLGASSWPCPEMAASGMSHTQELQSNPALHTLVHPKSFAAHFPFNTNIWAAKRGQLQPFGEDLFQREDFFPYWWSAAERWFPFSADSDKHEFGLPWAYCEAIQPELQVAHRCRCREWDVCGHHQVAVQVCLQKHHTGYDELKNMEE